MSLNDSLFGEESKRWESYDLILKQQAQDRQAEKLDLTDENTKPKTDNETSPMSILVMLFCCILAGAAIGSVLKHWPFPVNGSVLIQK